MYIDFTGIGVPGYSQARNNLKAKHCGGPVAMATGMVPEGAAGPVRTRPCR